MTALRRRLCVALLCALGTTLTIRGSAAEPPVSVLSPREFQVKGVVKSVDPTNKTAVIQHETIPGFMEAMTMPFRVKNPDGLRGIDTGDEISFRLFVTDEESWIDRVVKLKASERVAIARSTSPALPAASAVPARPRHPLLDYAFTNELSQPVRLGDYRGQVLAITFIFTRCPIPDYCPRLTKNFEEAAKKLREMPGAPTNWHFFSVSFDTAFDTPPVLKAYGERFGYDPRHWSFLTGPADKIAELARLSDMKFEATGGLFSHNLRTLIIDPNGRLHMNIPVGGNLSDIIVKEVLSAAKATPQTSFGVCSH